MAINKQRLVLQDTKPDRPTRRATTTEEESVVSFGQPVEGKPTVRYAWQAGNDKVNHETFHRMLEEYREAKKRELALELKAKQLAAQLARTEQAAKRALVETDATARGGAAQKLLDAERAITKLRDENAELHSKLAREKKRASDVRVAYDETKKRLDVVLKDQRTMVRKVGDLERRNALLGRKPEDDFWGEEAGRRFAAQQEELVALREENLRLHHELQHGGFAQPRAGAGAGEAEDPAAEALRAQVSELQGLVNFYERKMATLAEQHLIPAVEGNSQGPSPEDWILEEHFHEEQMYQLDRKTGKLFSVATPDSWPRPVGVRTGTQVKLGSNSTMERFINTLDNYMQAQQAHLQAVFNEFDLDGSGQLDRRELARLVKRLMPELTDSRQIDELGAMLDLDGDGQVTFQELLETIKEAFQARMAVKAGRSPELNHQLERVREVLRERKKVAREAFDALDTDHDGCLHHLDVVRLLRQFIKDLTQKEVRYLLARLQEWDVTGEGKCSWPELLQALELVRIYRVNQGMGGKAVPLSPGRAVSPGRTSLEVVATKTTIKQTATGGMREGFLRERLAQLEAELQAAQKRESALEADTQHMNVLRRECARLKARIEELERDYGNLDVLLRANEAAACGDAQLHAAWEAAAQFKKRYLEHQAELRSIRETAARMQAQLDETHRLLHQEHKKRYGLEDELTRLRMELQRLRDLEARVELERKERVKLEREYLNLQSKALNAPGNALGELRTLREEIFALRRDKALAEAKEAEVRRELSHLREQLDGMSLEQYRAWQREYHELKKRVATLTLELQAANDKLDVYRRTDVPGVAGIVFGNESAPGFLDRRPDVDKNEDEVRRELAQLREVWHADQQELKKLHKVLEAEAGMTLEAKAALEEAHREMDRLRRDLQDQIRAMQRELDRRDERIRKLELQLRGAYSGINRALRSSKLRDSRLVDSPDDLSELGDDQNLLELHISEATLYEEQLGKDPSTFFTFDFFLHDTQATPVLASNAPTYDTLVQYVVDQDPFLLQYLDTHVLELELNRARGWDYDPVGVARVPLRQILEDVEIGAALGHNRAYHYADVHGADGRRVGRVRYGFAFRRPLDNLVRDYRLQARSKRPSEPDARDPATQAVQLAVSTPAAASHVKVVVARCEQLASPSHAGQASRPYVWFRFPGTRDPHTTKMLFGANPTFNDESNWLIARTPDLEQSFKTREMEFVVFDDAGGEDPLRGIVGVAFVPLAALAQGVPVEGAFRLHNPVSKQPAGVLVLGMGWHNPLALANAKLLQQQQHAANTTVLAQARNQQQQQQQQVVQSPAVLYGAAAGHGAQAGRRSTVELPPFPPRRHSPPHAGAPSGGDFGLQQELGYGGLQVPQASASPLVPGGAAPHGQARARGSLDNLPAFPSRDQRQVFVPENPAGGFGLHGEPSLGGGVPPPGRFVPPRVPQERFGLYPQQAQQAPYGGAAAAAPTPGPGSMLLPGAAGGAAQQRYGLEVERSPSPPPVQQQQVPSLAAPFMLLSPDPALWPPRETHIVVAVDSLQLEPGALAYRQQYTHVFLMHALLEGSVQRLEDTCTMCVPLLPGPHPLSYAVAYRVVGQPGDVLGQRAGADLLSQLQAQDAFLDLKLYASRSSTVDLSQLAPGSVGAGGVTGLAVAGVSLHDVAAGRAQDMFRVQVPLVLDDERQQTRMGSVALTLYAQSALRTLQQQAGVNLGLGAATAGVQLQPQGGVGGAAPYGLPQVQQQQQQVYGLQAEGGARGPGGVGSSLHDVASPGGASGWPPGYR